MLYVKQTKKTVWWGGEEFGNLIFGRITFEINIIDDVLRLIYPKSFFMVRIFKTGQRQRVTERDRE